MNNCSSLFPENLNRPRYPLFTLNNDEGTAVTVYTPEELGCWLKEQSAASAWIIPMRVDHHDTAASSRKFMNMMDTLAKQDVAHAMKFHLADYRNGMVLLPTITVFSEDKDLLGFLLSVADIEFMVRLELVDDNTNANAYGVFINQDYDFSLK